MHVIRFMLNFGKLHKVLLSCSIQTPFISFRLGFVFGLFVRLGLQSLVKSQCQNIIIGESQISLRELNFGSVPPRQSSDITVSRREIKKSPSALHLDKLFSKVKKI